MSSRQLIKYKPLQCYSSEFDEHYIMYYHHPYSRAKLCTYFWLINGKSVPWFCGYGRRLMSKRSWVLIPVTHTRLILFTIFGVKIVLVFDEKTKINETKDPLHRESNSSRLFLKQEDSNKVSVTRFGYFWKVLTSNCLRKLGYVYVFLMRQSWPLFVYFCSFLVTISIQIEKSVDGVLGFEPGATGW